MSTNLIQRGTIISLRDNQFAVVLDVNDDSLLHTINSEGLVVQYKLSDIDRTLGEVDIKSELGSICSKLKHFQRDMKSKEQELKEIRSKRPPLQTFKVSNLPLYNIVLIVGQKNSGKTTLVNRLISETKSSIRANMVKLSRDGGNLIMSLERLLSDRKQGETDPLIVILDGIPHYFFQDPVVINLILTGKECNMRFWITSQGVSSTPFWLKEYADLILLFGSKSQVERKKYRDLFASTPREWDLDFESATSKEYCVCVYDPQFATDTGIRKLESNYSY